MPTRREFESLLDMLMETRRELAAVKRELSLAVKVGVVSDVDAEKGYRLEFGTLDGKKKKTAWLPHPEHGGDALSWVPLSVGQIVTQIGPPGDPRQSVLLRSGFTDQYKQPSKKLDENVFEYGKSKVTVRKERVLIQCDESYVNLIPGEALLGVGMEGEDCKFTRVRVTESSIELIVHYPNKGRVRRVLQV
jgi:hypothetical protein